ncbi:alpha/beta-hydrolase [Hypoxylon sp. FL1284]|nr:alpha/beta-hydrolase [Hypoxylon sp. FL1284]
MKPFSCVLISALALPAIANPFPGTLRVNDIAVTEDQLSTFRFFAQYAAASFCNSEAPAGSVITCAENVCPDVTAAGAKVLATFDGEVTDIQGFVSTDDTNRLIVVSMKGSESVRNWLADFAFIQAPCDLVDDCSVHVGFLTAYQEIQDVLLDAVANASATYPDYKIIFTGHSLGGAVTTLAAGFARKRGFAADLYTFGSPRVGNEAFVSYVTNQTGTENRVTHVDDPVPRLPPIFLDYRHTSPEYWLSTGEANTTAYSVADVKVCEGFANVDCNAATSGLDGDAHVYYFEHISGCDSGDFSFRRRSVTSDMATTDPEDISDADLEAKLSDFAAKDREYVSNMTSTRRRSEIPRYPWHM